MNRPLLIGCLASLLILTGFSSCGKPPEVCDVGYYLSTPQLCPDVSSVGFGQEFRTGTIIGTRPQNSIDVRNGGTADLVVDSVTRTGDSAFSHDLIYTLPDGGSGTSVPATIPGGKHLFLRVVFAPNFNVSLAMQIYPSADISEQISLAGKEASGTGNMKFALNGAVTIGTLDGANVEIREAVGPENFFLFGLTAEEVVERRQRGYNPYLYYEHNQGLREVVDRLAKDHFSPSEKGVFHPLLNEILSSDRFMVMADFTSYCECQKQVATAFLNQEEWTRMAIRNMARCGRFSSDRTIRQYAEEIWEISSVPIQLPEYIQPQ